MDLKNYLLDLGPVPLQYPTQHCQLCSFHVHLQQIHLLKPLRKIRVSSLLSGPQVISV